MKSIYQKARGTSNCQEPVETFVNLTRGTAWKADLLSRKKMSKNIKGLFQPFAKLPSTLHGTNKSYEALQTKTTRINQQPSTSKQPSLFNNSESYFECGGRGLNRPKKCWGTIWMLSQIKASKVAIRMRTYWTCTLKTYERMDTVDRVQSYDLDFDLHFVRQTHFIFILNFIYSPGSIRRSIISTEHKLSIQSKLVPSWQIISTCNMNSWNRFALFNGALKMIKSFASNCFLATWTQPFSRLHSKQFDSTHSRTEKNINCKCISHIMSNRISREA